MSESKKPAAPTSGNTLMLLAVTSLAVSNMFVGIVNANRFLIAASALLAAAFAFTYLFRSRLFTPFKARSATERYGPKLPIWVYGVVLFVALPAFVAFMQFIDPTLVLEF
ncbi:MAG: hypothetical protein AAFV37_09480 [Pseudomonadota bacterium]